MADDEKGSGFRMPIEEAHANLALIANASLKQLMDGPDDTKREIFAKRLRKLRHCGEEEKTRVMLCSFIDFEYGLYEGNRFESGIYFRQSLELAKDLGFIDIVDKYLPMLKIREA